MLAEVRKKENKIIMPLEVKNCQQADEKESMNSRKQQT